jgi:hypothetical protein
VVLLLGMFKEKSWSVRLVNGYILNNQVKSDLCKGCESATKLIAGNNDDPDLLLFGCAGHRCKHVLIRLKFFEADHSTLVQSLPVFGSTIGFPQVISSSAQF